MTTVRNHQQLTRTLAELTSDMVEMQRIQATTRQSAGRRAYLTTSGAVSYAEASVTIAVGSGPGSGSADHDALPADGFAWIPLGEQIVTPGSVPGPDGQHRF